MEGESHTYRGELSRYDSTVNLTPRDTKVKTHRQTK